MTLKPFDELTIFANQGDRPAMVLAVLGDQALVEYQMPKGTTALRILASDDDGDGRTVSYTKLSLDWLKAIVDADTNWIGRPQQSGHRILASPRIELARRLKAKKESFPASRTTDGMSSPVQALEEDLAGYANEVVALVQMAANPKSSGYVADLAIRKVVDLVSLADYTLAQNRPWAALGRDYEVGPADAIVQGGRVIGTVQEVANRPHWDLTTGDISLRRAWDAVRFDMATNGTGYPVPGGTKLTNFRSWADAVAWIDRFGGFRIGDRVRFLDAQEVPGVFTVTDLAVSFGWSPARFEGDITKGVPTVQVDRYMIALPGDLVLADDQSPERN